ncbi:hypothetical protein TUM16655_22310 [Enterobacter cloacae]|nr:hypothetical protein TUM16655_22310 [Enterobacter cloacae]GJK85226.1 hypothetical protein TUM17567_15210 [Citrobacter amalonaticus]
MLSSRTFRLETKNQIDRIILKSIHTKAVTAKAVLRYLSPTDNVIPPNTINAASDSPLRPANKYPE